MISRVRLTVVTSLNLNKKSSSYYQEPFVGYYVKLIIPEGYRREYTTYGEISK